MLERRIVRRVRPVRSTHAQVDREFRALLAEGASLRACGSARRNPGRMLSSGYAPKHAIRLFDTTFYLTHLRESQHLRLFVAWVLLHGDRLAPDQREIHARVFYKDSSLVWRSPTHHIRSERENWIGKGAVKLVREAGAWVEYGAEETTNLPLEIQPALDLLSRLGQVRQDPRVIDRILRRAPDGRFAPYRDFSAPRARASSDPRNLIHGGEPVAWFTRRNDPESLRFARGYEPDFGRGVLEVSRSRSRLYGGAVRKFRILSRNREIQYQFAAGPRHVWIIPPQALTTELSSYGVRTIDVEADEALFVPGYEYHFVDQTGSRPQLHSQIPEGFAGAPSLFDPSRADASAWLERLPVIREFRRRLGVPARSRPAPHST